MDPLLYTKHKSLQMSDALYVIENYLRLIKWQKEKAEQILDIGCGDGQVTIEILYPQLPTTIGKVIASDLSENMIAIAKQKYRNPQIDFQALDVSGNIPENLCEKFDHVFSFYCLHWVQNQTRAFENIFKMLRSGGDILLTFLATCPIFDAYELLAKDEKWNPYKKDVKDFISPYHHSKNPEKQLDNLLIDTGFVSHVCRAENRTFQFASVHLLKSALSAVCPFLSRIPKEDIDNYKDDFIKVLRTLKNVSFHPVNNNEEKIVFSYDLFIVFASKPPINSIKAA